MTFIFIFSLRKKVKIQVPVTHTHTHMCRYIYIYIYIYIYTRAVHKKTELYFFYLLLYLQLNQTCLLQSTPLYSWYNTTNVFSSSGMRPGTCFAGRREGPVSNFLLPPLPSEIGELLTRISTSGTRKIRRGQIWRVGWLGDNSRLMLRQKFTDKWWCVSRCIVMVQHSGVVCPRLRPLPSHCRP